MDVRISCPICGQTDVDCLPDHLQSHSKQSLIDILLVQHQQIRRQHSSSNVHLVSRANNSSEGVNVGNSSRRDGDSNQILLEHQPSSNNNNHGASVMNPVVEIKTEHPNIRSTHNHKTTNNSMLRIEYENEHAPRASANQHSTHKSKSHHHHVKMEGNTGITKDVKASSKHGHPTFVLVDHGSKPGPSKRRVSDDRLTENAKNNNHNSGSTAISEVQQQATTSIIQYIIDESGQITDSPQEEPDSWILADGRTIPVYSSLTQVPAVAESTPSCTINVDITNKTPIDGGTAAVNVERHSSHSQMHLDLMTDEEIPPRGEISEYEESNASSILSEDSNLRPNGSGMFGISESRRSPATVIHEQNLTSRKKKLAKAVAPQQYVCQECPQHQVFSSLFELAEHKFESHQNKSVTSTTVTITPPEEHILPDLNHILPEKIRRQSHTEDLETKPEPQIELKPPETIPIATTSSSTTKKEYFCVYCNFTAKKKAVLSEHMENDHKGKPRVPSMFECTYCGKIFQARTNLRKHLLIHKDRKYSCPTCPRGFTSNYKLIEHMRVHSKIYPFKCTHCEKTYRTLSLLNHHIKMVHLPEGERPPKRKLEFYCSVCHRILHSKRSYLNHALLHHEKPMKCSFCSETFNRNSVLVRHIRVAHDPQYESKESKDCPVCHKKLHPNSMIKHMRIHSNEKPYSCNVCGKQFRTYANLTSHSWSHTNVEKPHKCRQCSKSYLFKKNLENHMLVHKKRTMHFVCNECGVKFTHKVNMKRHLEEHFKEKSHVCKTCGKAFQRHYYLTEHERIHSGVKPFTCNICGKASTTKSNHRAHLKIHDARETGNQEG